MTRAHTDLMTETMDFLTQLETLLTAATLDEQIAIECACETIYGTNEGNHYQKLTTQITGLRDRIYDHLNQ